MEQDGHVGNTLTSSISLFQYVLGGLWFPCRLSSLCVLEVTATFSWFWWCAMFVAISFDFFFAYIVSPWDSQNSFYKTTFLLPPGFSKSWRSLSRIHIRDEISNSNPATVSHRYLLMFLSSSLLECIFHLPNAISGYLNFCPCLMLKSTFCKLQRAIFLLLRTNFCPSCFWPLFLLSRFLLRRCLGDPLFFYHLTFTLILLLLSMMIKVSRIMWLHYNKYNNYRYIN